MNSPQKTSGPSFKPGRPARNPGSPMKPPHAGTGNHQTSTHVDRIADKGATNDSGGRVIDGQNLRGAVRRNLGTVRNATMAADGVPKVRVRKGTKEPPPPAPGARAT